MMPVWLSAEAVGRYSSFGRRTPVRLAMYRMNPVPKPPPAMRILRVVCAEARNGTRAPDSPNTPSADSPRNSRRFIRPASLARLVYDRVAAASPLTFLPMPSSAGQSAVRSYWGGTEALLNEARRLADTVHFGGSSVAVASTPAPTRATPRPSETFMVS